MESKKGTIDRPAERTKNRMPSKDAGHKLNTFKQLKFSSFLYIPKYPKNITATLHDFHDSYLK